MKQRFSTCTCLVLALSMCAFAAAARDWQSGTLMDTEQQQVHQGTMRTTNTDGTFKDKGNKTQYSGTSTTNTVDNVDTYQVYTVRGANKTYIAREQLMFPWSKPANITVGEKVKYVIDRNKMIILDDNGKEHKAGIVKVSLNNGHDAHHDSH